MSSFFSITIRFLEPYSHGRSDSGEPEWPPSPLRLFQALVAAAAARCHDRILSAQAVTALKWLETQPSPTIAAARGFPSQNPYLLYIPNNTAELVVPAWRKGETKKTVTKEGKVVRPIQLTGDAVHYVYTLTNSACPHLELLSTAARSITHLGWGIDVVVGNLEVLTQSEAARLPGDVWHAVLDPTETKLRAPKEGTLDALNQKHIKFLGRLTDESFKPVPALSVFRVVGYRRVTDSAPPQIAAFSILKPDASAKMAFDPLRRTREIAGMVRHSVATLAHDQGWTEERINVFVHGKTPNGSEPSKGSSRADRFQYLPLPTINYKLGRVETIRRVIVTAPSHRIKEISWVRRALSGAELERTHGGNAMLTTLEMSDWVVKQYIGNSKMWSTVTPVILPGYDDPDHLRRKLKDGRDAETQKRYLDRLDERVEVLLRKAFRQAGFSNELMANTHLEWRTGGFHRGVELASQYLPPENLNQSTRYHVKVVFPHPVPGPIAVGSGRFRGFGLFAMMNQ